MGRRLIAFVTGCCLLAAPQVAAEQSLRAVQPVAYHVQAARATPAQQAGYDKALRKAVLPDTVKQGLGCLIVGTAATTLAALGGGDEVISVIAGGGLPPTNRMVYLTGLLSVVFVSFCAIGQTMTPLYSHLTAEEEENPPGGPIQIHRGASPRHQDVSSGPPSFRANLRRAMAEGGRQ